MVESSGTDTTRSTADRRSEIPQSSHEHGSVASGLTTDQTSRPVSHPAATSKPGQTQTLWILILKGHPRDLQSTRITELYIAFGEDEGTNITIRLQGVYPNFRVQEEWNLPRPWTRRNYYRRLAVSTWKDLGMRVRDAIWTTPVNTELDYGCQSWVGDVVTVLQDANLITAEEGDNALNEQDIIGTRTVQDRNVRLALSGSGRWRDVNEMDHSDGNTKDRNTKDRNTKDRNTKDRNTKDRNMKGRNKKDEYEKDRNEKDRNTKDIGTRKTG
ncbi:hypothetical protein F5Y14DRAFT_449220 [Nemania sp. NC0429]|nr:hypothetical protein F5Y14DRAFT_449220 [Nemania sp. NC0429]